MPVEPTSEIVPGPRIASPRSAAGRAAWLATRVLMVLTLACAWIPFDPRMPEAGLDPSWMIAVNEAAARGMAFGRDLVFTYGPLAVLYTRVYHPGTDAMALVASIPVFVGYVAALWILSAGRIGLLLVASSVAIGALVHLPDPMVFWYPLLVLACADRLLPAGAPDRASRLAAFALLCVPFGLLPLVKGSMLISCGAVAGLLGLQLAIERRWSAVAVLVGVPTFTLVAGWVAVGQPVDALLDYFRWITPIISGYTAAMSSLGPSWEPLAVVAGSAVVLAALWLGMAGRPRRPMTLLAYALSLFLAFKGGFVRHDGHALVAGGFLLLASLSLVMAAPTRWTAAALLPAALVWGAIYGQYLPLGVGPIVEAWRNTHASAWQGAVDRFADPEAPDRAYRAALARIDREAGLLPLEGRADIYSHRQADLIASGARWSPRPVFQSYSAYTPALAELNRRHLTGAGAPDSIAFRVEPIDGRVPAGEDGASWPALLAAYRPVGFRDDVLVLRRAAGAVVPEPRAADGAPIRAEMGAPVAVPAGAAPVFVRIDVRPSWLGRLAGIVYKPGELRIGLRLVDGRTRTARFVAGPAPAGFVISPWVEDTTEFGMLYSDRGYLGTKRVESFWITAEWPARLWSQRYEVRFEPIGPTPSVEVRELLGFQPFVQLEAAAEMPIAERCDGNVDSMNGLPVGTAPIGADGLLTVSGWLAMSTEPAVLPERVLLSLSDASGARHYVRTRTVQRTDLGQHFRNPAMDTAGFAATVDVSALKGPHELGVVVESAGRTARCPQFRIPVTLRGAA